MNRWLQVIWPAWLILGLGMASCSWPTEARTRAFGQPGQEAPAQAHEAARAPTSPPARQASPTPQSPLTRQAAPTPLPSPTSSPTATLSPQAWAARLRLSMPIVAAHVPEWLDLVPGASRDYRSGVHEGVDFGFDAVGVTIRNGTRVVAAGDGVVVRADSDYREPSAKEKDEILARSRRLGGTAPADLDRLRGRQVWIDHGEGVVTRYAHLEGVASGVAPGVRVSRGQLVAYVGSSGVPGEGTADEPHLHFEIRLGDTYLGQGLPPGKARELYVQALSGRNER